MVARASEISSGQDLLVEFILVVVRSGTMNRAHISGRSIKHVIAYGNIGQNSGQDRATKGQVRTVTF